MEHTLVLNASYEPINIITWKRALTLLYQGKVEVLAEYDREIRAISFTIKLPSEIPWKAGNGSEQAVLVGDPTKPGLYVVLQKWLPHNNSRPHYHPNDRFIQVLSGTWWVQTGAKYDPAGFKPIPAGSLPGLR